jgi:hypothetical protein
MLWKYQVSCPKNLTDYFYHIVQNIRHTGDHVRALISCMANFLYRRSGREQNVELSVEATQ